ncbi:MAG TPA: methyltransferase domain-containing protein, partial [Burkholderiales bacterium]|nr:methyltransferase domain-containing protein [Burkholderiales bacterium]
MNGIKKLWLDLAASAAFFTTPALSQEGVGDVVYVPTPQIVVDEMLRMAKVGPNDYLIDLGSGDGRFVITAAQKGARAFGVDLDTYLLRLARENAQKAGMTDKATFIEQN